MTRARTNNGPRIAEQQADNKQVGKKKTQEKKLRVQFEFTPEALARLDALKEVTSASTRGETLRNALRLYEWFVNEAESDSTILCMNDRGEVVSQFKAKLLL